MDELREFKRWRDAFQEAKEFAGAGRIEQAIADPEFSKWIGDLSDEDSQNWRTGGVAGVAALLGRYKAAREYEQFSKVLIEANEVVQNAVIEALTENPTLIYWEFVLPNEAIRDILIICEDIPIKYLWAQTWTGVKSAMVDQKQFEQYRELARAGNPH